MIYVSPLSLVDDSVQRLAPSHLISLLSPEAMIETPGGIAPSNHLKVGVNDIPAFEDGKVAPERRHAEEIVQFAKSWTGAAPILIHCWAGVSRSTAAAYITLCARNPETCEEALAHRLRAAAAHARPNPLLVSHADEVLGRDGRMLDAIDAIGEGEMCCEGVLFGLEAGPA